MSLIMHRVVSSLALSALCCVLILAYEYTISRPSAEDEPQDLLYLSAMVAVLVTLLAWTFILLPICFFVPQQSKLMCKGFSILMGFMIGTLFSITIDILICVLSGHPIDGLSSSLFVSFIIPGALCGAFCGGMFGYLDRRCMKGKTKLQKPPIAPSILGNYYYTSELHRPTIAPEVPKVNSTSQP